MSTILDMLCEREMTPEQREAKRLRARARRERARAAREENPVEVSDELQVGDDDWLLGQWRKANEKYFGGTLHRPNILEWDRSKGRHGVCTNDYDPSKKKIFCSRISISENASNYSTFRNTLVHEMVHQWVYQNYTDDDIRAANRYGQARSRHWWRALTRDTGKDGHHGKWLAKVEELMAKFPELHISKYGSEVEDEVSDEKKVERASAAATAHVLVRKPNDRKNRYFYYVTDEAYKRLLEKIKDGSNTDGWYEYDFDRKKMQERIKDPMTQIGNQCYRIGYFEQLREDGVIFYWTEKELNRREYDYTPRRRSFRW